MALRNFDPDIATALNNEMVKSGIHVHANTNGVAKVTPEATGDKKLSSLSMVILFMVPMWC